MSKHHNHGQGRHHHGQDIYSSLSFDEKLIKRLEHWVKHNNDHAESYKEWAKKAKTNEMEKTGKLLEDVAEMTRLISMKFEEAIRDVKRG